MSLRDHGDVHTSSMNCKTETSTTLEVLQLRNLHCFQHWLDQARHLSLKNNRRVNCFPKNCAVESASSAQFALCVPVSVHNRDVQHSGDEQNLRHFYINRHGLLELALHVHGDVHNCVASALPSICIPLWAGGVHIHPTPLAAAATWRARLACFRASARKALK